MSGGGRQRGTAGGAAHAAAYERHLTAQLARVVAGGYSAARRVLTRLDQTSQHFEVAHAQATRAAAGSMRTIGRETITTRTHQLEGSETPSQ